MMHTVVEINAVFAGPAQRQAFLDTVFHAAIDLCEGTFQLEVDANAETAEPADAEPADVIEGPLPSPPTQKPADVRPASYSGVGLLEERYRGDDDGE